MPLTDAAGRPAVRPRSASPAATSGLQAAARQARPTATGIVIVCRTGSSAPQPDGQPIIEDLYPAVALAARRDAGLARASDLSIGLTDFGEFTLLIAKQDPGQGLVWIAFASLIAGITITFYRPRRRVWTRLRRTAGWRSSGGRTATSTSSASSAGCSTSSSPPAGRPEPRRASDRPREVLRDRHNACRTSSMLNRNLSAGRLVAALRAGRSSRRARRVHRSARHPQETHDRPTDRHLGDRHATGSRRPRTTSRTPAPTSTASTSSTRAPSASTSPSRSSRSCAGRSTATSRSIRRSSTPSPTA